MTSPSCRTSAPAASEQRGTGSSPPRLAELEPALDGRGERDEGGRRLGFEVTLGAAESGEEWAEDVGALEDLGVPAGWGVRVGRQGGVPGRFHEDSRKVRGRCEKGPSSLTSL